MDFSNFKVRKVNGERKIFADITAAGEVNNNFTVEVQFYKKQGGEYRLMPFKLSPKPYCDFLYEHMDFYEEILETSNFQQKPNVCPVSKVNISLNKNS